MASTDLPAPPAVSPAPPRVRRRRLWLLLAGGLFLAGGLLLAWQGWGLWNESAARKALAAEHFDEARDHINRALQVRERSSSTHLLAARIARERGAYAEAEQHLNRCSQLDGMSEPVQREWMLLRCVRGEVDELAPGLLALVGRNDPDSPAILEAVAGIYMRQTRYGEALHCLDRWVELDPNSARALDWRGWVHNQLDHRQMAIADYERALELQPGRSLVRVRLAELYVASARHSEAVPHLERIRAEQPDNYEVLVLLAQCRLVESRLDEARDLLETVLKAQPDNSDALLYMGKLEQAAGNSAEAERWFRKCLEGAPRHIEARYSLYLCLQGQPGREADAKQELDRWEHDRKTKGRLVRLLRTELDRSPKSPDLAEETGRLLLEEGEDEKGLFWLYRALKLDPRHAASLRDLIAYYERTHNEAKAAELRQKLEALGPEK